MTNSISLLDAMAYLFLYSFVGWALEVCCFALKDRHFVNRGMLNVPFAIPYGITAVILLLALPTIPHMALQFIMCMIVWRSVWSLTKQFVRGLSHNREHLRFSEKPLSPVQDFLLTALIGGVYLVLYLLVHPLVYTVRLMLPELIIRIIVIVCSSIVILDLGCVLYSMKTSVKLERTEKAQTRTRRIADQIRNLIRNRLERAYPGILTHRDEVRTYVFAQGICLDKLIWVFLVSSFLGALIEMVFCRITGGTWMNRSSLLYGSFSVVWGLGAVVLTVTLQRLADKADRYVFLAGFIVGGAYEYLCSVFTELVFGTVFWDYSDMPLNIGGRTNVLYCIFWGLLAVAWIKVLYPPMSKGIEKIPTLFGKILTWVLIFLLICDGILTATAMVRYTDRQTNPESGNAFYEFLDEEYDDAFMEHRWPNMALTEE